MAQTKHSPLIGFSIVHQFEDYSLRVKFIITFLVLSVLSIGTVAFFANRTITTMLTAEAGTNLKNLADTQALEIGNLLARQLDTLRSLSLSRGVRDRLILANTSYGADPAEIQARLAELDQEWMAAKDDTDFLIRTRLTNAVATELLVFRQAFPAHVEVLVTDKHGGIMAATGRTSAYYQADEDWWQAAYNGGQGALHISQPTFDESSNIVGLNFAVPFVDDDGAVIGVLRSTYDLSVLADLLTLAQFGQTGRADIYIPDGQELEVEEGELEFHSADLGLNSLVQLQASTANYAEALHGDQITLIGQSPLAAISGEPVIAKLGWTVVARQERAEALAPVKAQTRSTLLLGLGIVVVAIVVAIFVAQRLANPLTRLTAIAQQVTGGNLTVRARVESRDEVGDLAHSFNTMADQLRDTIGTLEDKVAQRTQQFQTVAEVGRQLSGILGLSDLMREVVNLTKETFAYYHTHIYLLDEPGETLVMAEGYGLAGVEMKRQGHSILLTAPRSLVARAARDGKIITVKDVQADPDWLPNPLLPDTRAEMAVPIMSGTVVLGVLDVQSEKVGGLILEDERTLSALANHIAVAVRNARLFTETQDKLYEAQRLQRLYTGEAWEKFGVTQSTTNYEARQPALPPLEQIDTPEAVAAIHQKQTVDLRFAVGDFGLVDPNGESAKNIQSKIQNPKSKIQSAMATPLKLRDEIIGVLGIQDEGSNRQWTEDEIALIEAVSEQMSLAIENARLFDETGRRAAREKIISDVTGQIWASGELEQVMQTAIERLGTVLEASKAVIRLGTPPQLINDYYQLVGKLGPMPPLSKPYKIGAVLKFLGNERWQLMAEGMQAQAKEYGIQLDAQAAASESDFAGQLALMEAMIAQGDYDAFIVSPQSSQNLLPAIEKARAAGILIVNGEDAVILDAEHWVGPNHYKTGVASATYLLQQLPQDGKVAVIEGQAGSNSAELRTKGFIETLAETGLKVVVSIRADWNWQKAFDAAAKIIKEHPDIEAFYANNDVMALAVVEAIKEADQLGQIMVIGADGIEQAYNAIRAGEMTATNTIFPALGGQVTLELTLRRLEGQELSRVIWSPQSLVTLANVDNPHPASLAPRDTVDTETLAFGSTRKVWGDIARKVSSTGYVFTQFGLTPAPTAWLPTMGQAVQLKRLAQSGGDNQATVPTSMAIPLMLRGEVIGAIGIERFATSQGQGKEIWSVDEVATIQAVGEQVSLALDTARLARETEQRAAREEIIANLTRSVWAGDDIESVLQNSVTQLGQTLKASKVILHLNPDTKADEVKSYTAPNLLQSWMSGGSVGWEQTSSKDKAKKE